MLKDKKGFLIMLVLFSIFSITAPCLGQNDKESSTGEYTISPGDILEITVYQEPDLSVTVQVSEDGAINYPLLGNIRVSAMTVRDLEKHITELLASDYLVNPQLNIFVKEYTKISIIGQVRSPGRYEMKKSLSLAQAIALAGGFTETADTSRIKVIRTADGTKQELEVNLSAGASQDIEIKANDTIMVEAKQYVSICVLGQVKSPGTYQMKQGMTLAQAIALAGGFTETANSSRVKLTRCIGDLKRTTEVDVDRILEKELRDIKLNPDDMIVVGEYGRITIMGQVARPGVYNLKKGLTVVEAISIAGGFTPVANQNGTKVIRVKDGKKEIIQVRVSDISRAGDASKDILLQEGDTVVVPESFF